MAARTLLEEPVQRFWPIALCQSRARYPELPVDLLASPVVAPNVECADGKVDVERQAGHRAIRTDASHPSGKFLAPSRLLRRCGLGRCGLGRCGFGRTELRNGLNTSFGCQFGFGLYPDSA